MGGNYYNDYGGKINDTKCILIFLLIHKKEEEILHFISKLKKENF